MKRDMELVRKILFEIENKHKSGALVNLNIEGYDMETVAYHCQIMYEAGLVLSYKPFHTGEGLYSFAVGGLTWDGNDYLEKTRDDTIWRKIMQVITDKGLPFTIDIVKSISSVIISSVAQGVMDSIVKNGITP